jgi:hypothetical protein
MATDHAPAQSPAQSDDSYERISFLNHATGEEVPGVMGWREGAENRVVFQVWDGPSFAAEGVDLASAFAAARAGIVRAGFTPQPPVDGGLGDLFTEAESAAPPPRVQPVLWLLAAAILLALLIPVLARAEVPEWNKRIPFPNAPYDYRYEGPNYDSRDGSRNSTARMRHEAKERGDPDWLNIPLDPIVAIVERGSGRVIARYRLEGGQFCDYEDDNCDLDGLFPLVLSTEPQEPVLAVVRHVGAHGQRISVLRPLADATKPVFEATADFALGLRLRRNGLDVIVDRAGSGGEARKEMLHWPDAPAHDRAALPDVILPSAPPLSPSASAFDARLRGIAAARDLPGFVALLTDDVLVSFGGNGGKAEFSEYWRLDSDTGRKTFWATLDRLLAQGAWIEAGGQDDDGDSFPQRITYPWFFAAWPGDVDAENAFIADEDAALRAAPHDGAPVLARLPRAAVLRASAEEGNEVSEWLDPGWLEVVAPGRALGFVRQEDVTPLLGTRMLAVETGTGWKIEAFVAGD